MAMRTSSSQTKSTDRKSTRLNSSHLVISYAVFCLKKKKTKSTTATNATSSHTTCTRAVDHDVIPRSAQSADLYPRLLSVALLSVFFFFFFFNDTATTEIYTLSLHDALPIWEKPTDRKALSVATTPLTL